MGAIFVSAWNLLSWFYPQTMPDPITLIKRAFTFEIFEYGTWELSHWRYAAAGWNECPFRPWLALAFGTGFHIVNVMN